MKKQTNRYTEKKEDNKRQRYRGEGQDLEKQLQNMKSTLLMKMAKQPEVRKCNKNS